MCAVRDGTGYVAATDDDEAISRRCALENGVKAVSPWETSSERSAARWVLPGLSANMCQASRGEAWQVAKRRLRDGFCDADSCANLRTQRHPNSCLENG